MLGEEQVTFIKRVAIFHSPGMARHSWARLCCSRAMAIAKTVLGNSENWDLTKHYPGGFDKPTFPLHEEMPSMVAKREDSVLKLLDPEKRNMWRSKYAATPEKITK